MGPAAGFILGSFCTRLYVDLSDPGFGPSDPKWVGAWYLGKFPGIIYDIQTENKNPRRIHKKGIKIIKKKGEERFKEYRKSFTYFNKNKKKTKLVKIIPCTNLCDKLERAVSF